MEKLKEVVRKFSLEELQDELDGSGKFYLPFLNRNKLTAGLYQLKAGAIDPQGPHELDEVYYIVRGKSDFEADGRTWKVTSGDILYVAALEDHRFKNITEDLQILVFFSTMK